jgi:ligand-binding sensor protein
MKNILHLEDIIDIKKFQKIQDDIAAATGIAIIAVDYIGKALTNHSGCSEFCKLIRANDLYSHLCERCDSRGGVEAARLKKTYIYVCHKGLIDFATPIIVNGQYLGALMAGQVLIEETKELDLENIVSVETNFDTSLEKEKLEKAYSKLPVVSFKKVESLAEMMSHISNYIVEECLSKMLQKELDEKKLKSEEDKKIKEKLEKEYKSYQLKALQSQVNQNFLFNLLNSISSLAIVEDAPKTHEIIYNLSNMLRYALKKSDKIITLEEEFDYIKSYLKLQKIRFSERLNYEVNIDNQFKNIKIPFMILQTFVENSVIHGLEEKEDGGYVKVFASREENYIVIRIEDNGIGMEREQLNLIQRDLDLKDDTNIDRLGIKRASKRLHYYYEENYKIEIDSKENFGTLVKITILEEI